MQSEGVTERSTLRLCLRQAAERCPWLIDVHYGEGWLCLDNGTSLQIERVIDGEKSVNFDTETELKVSELVKNRSIDLYRQVGVGLAHFKAVRKSSGLE